MVTLHVYCMHFCMPGIPFDDIAQRNVGGGGPCKAIFFKRILSDFFLLPACLWTLCIRIGSIILKLI
jgi:hypothetical protein